MPHRYIEELYFKRFGKRCPENVRSVEQIVKYVERKKAARKARKQAAQRQSRPGEVPPEPSG